MYYNVWIQKVPDLQATLHESLIAPQRFPGLQANTKRILHSPYQHLVPDMQATKVWIVYD